jgi:hypothetical protein
VQTIFLIVTVAPVSSLTTASLECSATPHCFAAAFLSGIVQLAVLSMPAGRPEQLTNVFPTFCNALESHTQLLTSQL